MDIWATVPKILDPHMDVRASLSLRSLPAFFCVCGQIPQKTTTQHSTSPHLYDSLPMLKCLLTRKCTKLVPIQNRGIHWSSLPRFQRDNTFACFCQCQCCDLRTKFQVLCCKLFDTHNTFVVSFRCSMPPTLHVHTALGLCFMLFCSQASICSQTSIWCKLPIKEHKINLLKCQLTFSPVTACLPELYVKPGRCLLTNSLNSCFVLQLTTTCSLQQTPCQRAQKCQFTLS